MPIQRQRAGNTANIGGRSLVTPVFTSVMILTLGCGEQIDSTTSIQHDDQIATHASFVPVSTVGTTEVIWTPRVAVRDWQAIVIHHTASHSGSVESIHQVHQQRKDAAGNPWRGIGYHFVIGNGHGMEDGEVEATFRWREQLEGAHAGVSRYNQQGVGICLVGNFDDRLPTEAQLAALKRLVAWLSQEYDIPVQQVKGHGQLKATACPGKYFPMHELTRIGPTATNDPEFSTIYHPQL